MQRRTSVLFGFVIAAAVLTGTVLGAPPSPANAGVQEDQVFDLVNQQRASASLPQLIRDPTIEAAAEEWANTMATLPNPLTHSTNEWRAAHIPPGWQYNGENIAVGQTSAAQVMNDWMNSEGHRDNILSPNYTRIGIGYAATSAGIMWVQIFAGYVNNPPPPVLALGPTPTPTIAGAPAVATTLTASAGAWGPGEVTLAYQWSAGGSAIPGATGTTYMPNQADVGKPLSVTVTGSRSGYTTVSRTSPATAPVTSPFTTGRISGPDRYSGSVATAQAGFPNGASVVYLTNGVNYPDALSAGSAAAAQGGPLLLTPPDSIPAGVLAEITALHPSRIVLVGGTASISTAAEAQARGTGITVVRVQGSDRYATSRAVVQYAFGSTGAATAYVATGLSFPDALSASAAAAHSKSPILLVDGTASGADTATLSTLYSLHATHIKVAGGTASVSDGIQTSLSLVGSVERLSGPDRYATSVTMIDDAFTSAGTAFIANGLNFPDALSGGALSGAEQAPLFISPAECVPSAVLASLRSLGVSQVELIGGTVMLTQAVGDLVSCG
jgi:putative cell wall-binding protein